VCDCDEELWAEHALLRLADRPARW